MESYLNQQGPSEEEVIKNIGTKLPQLFMDITASNDLYLENEKINLVDNQRYSTGEETTNSIIDGLNTIIPILEKRIPELKTTLPKIQPSYAVDANLTKRLQLDNQIRSLTRQIEKDRAELEMLQTISSSNHAALLLPKSSLQTRHGQLLEMVKEYLTQEQNTVIHIAFVCRVAPEVLTEALGAIMEHRKTLFEKDSALMQAFKNAGASYDAKYPDSQTYDNALRPLTTHVTDIMTYIDVKQKDYINTFYGMFQKKMTMEEESRKRSNRDDVGNDNRSSTQKRIREDSTGVNEITPYHFGYTANQSSSIFPFTQ